MSKNIMLIGYMGTGKTTVSHILSEKLSLEAVDTDKLIIEREGKNISDIFNECGEDYFRNLETNILQEVMEKENIIVSCGGGIVLKEENINYLKRGLVILLTATPETIYERIKSDRGRPLLNNNMNIEYIHQMLKGRLSNYLKTADVIIETDGKNLDEISLEILLYIKNSINRLTEQ